MKFKKLHKNINFNSALIKAKVMNALGSTPNKIDDFMLIADNDIFGTIGGGTLEFQVINESKKLLINNKKENILKIPLGPGIGQCCGGYVQIKLSLHKNSSEALKTEKLYDDNIANLYIFGAGHIGQALITKLENINFNIFLIDSREDFLKMTNFNNINYLLSKKPWEIVTRLKDNSYFVILTHSYDYDLKILNEVLKKNFTFLGLIGSKTKKNKFFKRLIENGHNKSLVETIECPIGINIGNSKDPDEIAFSIITRIISIKNNLKVIKNNKIKEII